MPNNSLTYGRPLKKYLLFLVILSGCAGTGIFTVHADTGGSTDNATYNAGANATLTFSENGDNTYKFSISGDVKGNTSGTATPPSVGVGITYTFQPK